MFNNEDRKRLIGLAQLAVKNFHVGDWQALGLYTNATHIITGHDRLLRSLRFNDDDYSGNAHGVISSIDQHNPENLRIIEEYITEHYGDPSDNISTSNGKNRPITFMPSVFEIPEESVDPNLIAIMSPFTLQYEDVFTAIKKAGLRSGFHCLRARDIWQHTAVIQDVFSLIFRAHIVVCDFTDKNANVFYEAGIAHTLGKHVVPITQSAHDIPFDIQHHRYYKYLNNNEGLEDLTNELSTRFHNLK